MPMHVFFHCFPLASFAQTEQEVYKGIEVCGERSQIPPPKLPQVIGARLSVVLVLRTVTRTLRSHCLPISSSSSRPLMAAPLMPLPALLGAGQGLPILLLYLPRGCYGISYDIDTNKTEHDLPDGWNANRGNTYRQLTMRLKAAGFQRHQYSDYRNLNVAAIWTFWIMLSLRHIKPPGKLPTTVSGLKMHYIPDFALMDVTAGVQLGGQYSPAMIGPVPRRLVPGAMMAAAQPPPPHLHPFPPRHTKDSPAAQELENWRM